MIPGVVDGDRSQISEVPRLTRKSVARYEPPMKFEPYKFQPYPAVLYNQETGEGVQVANAEQEAALRSYGEEWDEKPPKSDAEEVEAPADPAVATGTVLNALTEANQQITEQNDKIARMEKLMAEMQEMMIAQRRAEPATLLPTAADPSVPEPPQASTEDALALKKCRECGETGHNARTCPKVNRKYRR